MIALDRLITTLGSSLVEAQSLVDQVTAAELRRRGPPTDDPLWEFLPPHLWQFQQASVTVACELTVRKSVTASLGFSLFGRPIDQFLVAHYGDSRNWGQCLHIEIERVPAPGWPPPATTKGET